MRCARKVTDRSDSGKDAGKRDRGGEYSVTQSDERSRNRPPPPRLRTRRRTHVSPGTPTRTPTGTLVICLGRCKRDQAQPHSLLRQASGPAKPLPQAWPEPVEGAAGVLRLRFGAGPTRFPFRFRDCALPGASQCNGRRRRRDALRCRLHPHAGCRRGDRRRPRHLRRSAGGAATDSASIREWCCFPACGRCRRAQSLSAHLSIPAKATIALPSARPLPRAKAPE